MHNTTKHTPLETNLAEDIGMFLEDRADHFIYWCEDRHAYTEKQVQAIAPKLAAAPAMYEALQAAYKLLREWTPSGEDNQGEVEGLIENALAQAEGHQHG